MLVDNVVIILGKVVVEEVDHNTRVKWFLPLDATYVNYKIASILYLKLIFMMIYGVLWANKLFTLKVYNN